MDDGYYEGGDREWDFISEYLYESLAVEDIAGKIILSLVNNVLR